MGAGGAACTAASASCVASVPAGVASVGGLVRELTHRRDEAIAATGHGDDEAIVARRFAERATQREDALAEVVFLDDGVGPHRFHERRFVEQRAAMLDQVHECLDGARAQRYRFAVRVEQHPPRGIEVKSPEFEHRHTCHRVVALPSERFSAFKNCQLRAKATSPRMDDTVNESSQRRLSTNPTDR